MVSDDEWLCKAGILLLMDLSVLFMWDVLSLEDLGNFLSFGKINLTVNSSVNISSIVRLTTDLLLNSYNVLLLLWVECMDDFRSASDVTGAVKLLLIRGMKEFLLFEKLFWLCNILPLAELVWKLNSDCTCVSKFSCNNYSFVFVLKLWEEVWICALNKSVKSLTI